MTKQQEITYRTPLVFSEIEQLLAFDKHGLTWAGDTISHSGARALIDKKLACRMPDGMYALTAAGQKLADEIRRVR